LQGGTYFITFRLRKGIINDDEKIIVLEAIKYFHKVRYWVIAAVVMPDHVHMMLKTALSGNNVEFSISKILQGLKGFSAREINKIRVLKATYGRMKVMTALLGIMRNF
jgi:REP element-mobilizing transposase RayT